MPCTVLTRSARHRISSAARKVKSSVRQSVQNLHNVNRSGSGGPITERKRGHDERRNQREKTGCIREIPNSGIWWIRYADSSGRIRHEKVGPKSAANTLMERRRADARKGIKMPENLRTKPATFAELAARGLDYSKANKRSYSHDVQRMKHLVEEFGNRPAEDITRG